SRGLLCFLSGALVQRALLLAQLLRTAFGDSFLLFQRGGAGTGVLHEDCEIALACFYATQQLTELDLLFADKRPCPLKQLARHPFVLRDLQCLAGTGKIEPQAERGAVRRFVEAERRIARAGCHFRPMLERTKM